MDPLQTLLDKQAIAEVIYTYCRAVDRQDWDLLAGCFHPDSTHRHGPFEGSSRDFLGFAKQVVEHMRHTHHNVGNILIDLRGDMAHTEAYWIAYHRLPADMPPGPFPKENEETDVVVAGRYIDRFERRDGVWRIAHRTGLHDWQRSEPARDGGLYDQPAEARGQRAPHDPVYAAGQ